MPELFAAPLPPPPPRAESPLLHANITIVVGCCDDADRPNAECRSHVVLRCGNEQMRSEPSVIDQ